VVITVIIISNYYHDIIELMSLFKRIENAIKALFAPSIREIEVIKDSEEDKESDAIETEEGGEEVHSIWDHLNLYDNTQAFHLSGVLTFDEWLTMEEIKRRIFELFGVKYKNDRSLYPYIKTMVDLGLVESHSAGGRRKCSKKDLLIRLKEKAKEKESESVEAKDKVSRKEKGKERKD